MVHLDLIEECLGRGNVTRESGELVREAEYRLQILQEMHETPSKDIPGLLVIGGWVEIDEADILLVGEPLSLQLEDGRRLDFFYVDSDGVIANRGAQGLYRPETA